MQLTVPPCCPLDTDPAPSPPGEAEAQPVGQVKVHPVIGIRHQGVERVVVELRGEKFHAYVPPTVSTPLYRLMPGSGNDSWVLGASDTEARSDDLAESVARFGLPLMESGSSLPGLCRLLDQNLGFPHQLVYRHPVAYALAGDLTRSIELLDRAEADLGERTDPAAAQLRLFIPAFRDRFGVSSSD